MALRRMEHVGIVVEDLAAARAFFAALGLEPAGEMSVAGEAVDRIVDLEGSCSDLAFMRTPDGHGALELIQFRSPPPRAGEQEAPPNTAGLRHLAFAVDDLEATLARLREHGGELVGEVVSYEDSFLLCYVRGPAGVIVELAEKLG